MRACLPALFLLTACAPTSGPVGPSAAGLSLEPGSGGIEVIGSGQEIGFGRLQPGAVTAASRVLGRQPDLTRACAGGGSAATWSRDGLTMIFDRQGGFTGWETGGGRTFTGEVRAAGTVCS